MISIQLKSAGKKFLRQWIFKELDLHILGPEKIAITGFNGSGKSTLLQVISGFQSLNQGEILFSEHNQSIPVAEWYKKISYAAPYLDLPDEYNMHELFSFYASFKPFLLNLKEDELIEIIELTDSKQKPIKYFSSGMKQRLRLALAILSDTPVLLLDEPLSNLDKKGNEWYKRLLQQYTGDKTVIVCSNNIEDEIVYCNRKFDIHDYKL